MKNLRRSTKVGLKIEFFKGVRISKGKDKAMEITIKVNKTIKYFSVMIKKNSSSSNNCNPVSGLT